MTPQSLNTEVVSISRDRSAKEPGGAVCLHCFAIFVGAGWHKLCGVCFARAEATIIAPRSLDAMDRCCGRKPHPYKRPTPHSVCLRCSAQYNEAGTQEPNWAWIAAGDGYRARYPEQDSYWPLLLRDVADARERDSANTGHRDRSIDPPREHIENDLQTETGGGE